MKNRSDKKGNALSDKIYRKLSNVCWNNLK